MVMLFKKVITYCYLGIFFFVPLILYPFSSEIFEFNKLVLVYAFTSVIVASWVGIMVIENKFVFRRTILDIPLLLFLVSQFISAILSIDTRTSFLGYYSRFHGGLASVIVYSLLYWAYVSNIDRQKTTTGLKTLLASGFVVCAYGVLQHFGIDKNLWVQDVQNRIFSTMGQPNWLAAWLVSLIPVAWVFSMKSSKKKIQHYLWTVLSAVFFLTLLYTKSRSGMLGLTAAWLIFWPYVIWKDKIHAFKSFIIHNSSFIILILLIGTPWTPSITNVTNKQQPATPISGTVLETGGTESGEIRKIVWKGAIDVWKNYPIFGSGLETFAFSYYQFRPVKHNLVSEWDFLYNKAHNEYLNFAATTGTVGIISYILLIIFCLYQISKGKKQQPSATNPSEDSQIWKAGLLAGFASILITNFFGFSVVTVALMFFLFPAMSSTIESSAKPIAQSNNISSLAASQKSFLLIVLCTMLYALFAISKYWYADTLYAKGKLENERQNYLAARNFLTKAIYLSPREALYISELAKADTNLALILHENERSDEASELAQLAERHMSTAQRLSSRNLNIKRDTAGSLTKLAMVDNSYLLKANRTLVEADRLAPTDAKIKFNLALSYLRIGQNDTAEPLLREVITIKPNYKEGYFTLAALLADKGERAEAIKLLEYVLTEIDPKDTGIKDFLEEIKNM